MQPLLIILLLLSILTNVLLILLLLRSGQQNTTEDQTDEIARIVRDEVEAETEVLADQLRVMQGEVTRTTSASARDMGTLLAESQRQSQEAATARLDAIDRAGAARQRAANDALLAQLQVLETRLKNLEDTNANRLDGVRATLLQGMANIRADNNKKLDEIRGTVDEKLEATLQRRVSESFRAVSTQLEQVYKGLGEMQNLAADVEAGAFRCKDPRYSGRSTAGGDPERNFGPRPIRRKCGYCARQQQPCGICRQATGPERNRVAAH